MVSPEREHVPTCSRSCNESTKAIRFNALKASDFAADDTSNNDVLQTLQKAISIGEPFHHLGSHNRLTDDELLQELDEFVCDDFADPTEEMLDFDGDEIDNFLLVCAV